MELITAIALLCQINIGIGTGDRSSYAYSDFKKASTFVESEQRSCQKQLANCILTKDKGSTQFRISTALKCIKDRL